MQNKKGFTIIELIVVIAIIAVLAGIVLVNVTSYINKGKDAAIKGNMSTMLTNAAVYFDANTSGTGATFIANSAYTTPEAAVLNANGNVALTKYGHASTQAWCACSKLLVTTNDTFCVDSTGYKANSTANPCSTRCPSAASPTCSN